MTAAKGHWTPDEIAVLLALYPDQSAAAVGRALGRAPGSVHQKAAALGIKKSTAFWAGDSAGRIQRGQQHPAMLATRFQAGNAPWNKGIEYDAKGRSHETRFKKGVLNSTAAKQWKPLGAYRLCEGQLQQKTSNTPGPNNLRWTPVTRLVWQAAHGPIPDGHIVVFKPGRTTSTLEEITLDKLDCITRAENARRNSVYTRYPPEVARLVQLRGALNKQINKRQKAAQPE